MRALVVLGYCHKVQLLVVARSERSLTLALECKLAIARARSLMLSSELARAPSRVYLNTIFIQWNTQAPKVRRINRS